VYFKEKPRYTMERRGYRGTEKNDIGSLQHVTMQRNALIPENLPVLKEKLSLQ
jgi:hypothetical protein